jgi:hypothetical protein
VNVVAVRHPPFSLTARDDVAAADVLTASIDECARRVAPAPPRCQGRH